MIAPTMLAVAETRSAVKRYGSAEGNRSFQSTVHRFAAYEASDRPHREAETRLAPGERSRLQERHDQQRALRVRPLEERLDHRVDVRHRRGVDRERPRPAVVDPERPEAFPETPEERGD